MYYCKYFTPSYFDNQFVSAYSKCKYFGDKNILSGKIEYDYAILCRNDEFKCGTEGMMFVKEPKLNSKIITHILVNNPRKKIIIFFLTFWLIVRCIFR